MGPQQCFTPPATAPWDPINASALLQLHQGTLAMLQPLAAAPGDPTNTSAPLQLHCRTLNNAQPSCSCTTLRIWNSRPSRNCLKCCRTHHLGYISQFIFDICHITGKENSVVDALSWHFVSAIIPSDSIDYAVIAAAQQQDPDLVHHCASASSPQVIDVPIYCSGITIACDTSHPGSPRPYIPEPHQREIFITLHILAHPGICATQCLLTQRVVWSGINVKHQVLGPLLVPVPTF